MDVNSTITITDKVLAVAGIEREDLTLVIFLLVAFIIAYFAKLKHRCGNSVSCEKTDEAMKAIKSMSDKIDHLHSNAAASDVHMDSIKNSHALFDSNLADIKADMALLQGIIMGINSGAQNKRIIHD